MKIIAKLMIILVLKYLKIKQITMKKVKKIIQILFKLTYKKKLKKINN